MKRLATALLLAPLWAPCLLAIATALFWPVPHVLGDISRLSWIWTATAAGALLAYAAILTIGLPAHIWLRRRSSRSLRAYLVTWFALAVIAWVMGFTAAFATLGLGFSLSYLLDIIIHRPYVPLAFGTVWAVVGATFWAIVRPDRWALWPLVPDFRSDEACYHRRLPGDIQNNKYRLPFRALSVERSWRTGRS